MRAWLAGWKCYYAPKAIAYHDVNRSIGTLSYTSVYYFSRNNIWVWLINIPISYIIRYLPQRILYEFSAAFYFCVLNKKLKPYVKGKIDAFIYCERIIRKRKIVQKKIRLSKKQIINELYPITKYLFKRSGFK